MNALFSSTLFAMSLVGTSCLRCAWYSRWLKDGFKSDYNDDDKYYTDDDTNTVIIKISLIINGIDMCVSFLEIFDCCFISMCGYCKFRLELL